MKQILVVKLLALVVLAKLFSSCVISVDKKKGTTKAEPLYTIVHTDAEWKKLLTDEQYYILRRKGTERPFTSPLNNEKRGGLYVCAADSTQLFVSDDKFNSGTGWPSFDAAQNLEYEWDGRALEVRCISCGGHLGHLFKHEGFTEKNLRYCINGDALTFFPDEL